MIKILRVSAILIVFLSGVYGGSADEPGKWTPELTLQVKQIHDVRPSPDGRWLAAVVGEAHTEGEASEWRRQIHLFKADRSESFQLTRSDDSAASPRWSPDGRWIAFLSSRGTGKSNLWRIRVRGGEAERLSDVQSGVQSFQWMPDGRGLAFIMTDPPSEEDKKGKKEKDDARVVHEDFRYAHLHLLSLDKKEGEYPVRRLTEGEFQAGGGFGGGFDVSPDGRFIAFTHTPDPLVNSWPESDISVVEVESGEVTPLADSPAAEIQPLYSPDGGRIAFTASDAPPTWAFTRRVHVVSSGGGEATPLANTYDQQPGLLGWTSDSSAILASETYHTVRRIITLPADGSAPRDFSPLDRMVSSPVLNRTGTHIGYVSQSPREAPEAALTPAGMFEGRTVSAIQDLPDIPLGRTEAIQWQSSDGMRVEGLLTYPVDYSQGRRVPLLVIVHGGPTGVFVERFIDRRGAYPIAPFTAEGYAILRCNVRGSSGYGRDFRYANYEDWGGGDYQDIMSGVDHVVGMGVADPERLGIMGWSYGGFMTSWVITQTDRFDAASVGAGVTNLMSFTGTADIPGFIPDYFGGEFWEVFDKWRSHSAMFQVGGVSTPTLIQHGEEDARVPVTQGYELYNALKRQDVPVRMVVYPRTPHGLSEPKLQLDAMRRNLEWFAKWVK